MAYFMGWNDLTFKQRLFCQNYVKNYGNGSQAAIDAGYSKKTAHQIAAENLNKPIIKEYIEKRMREVMEKAGVGIDWRLNLLKKTAEACFDGKADKDNCVDAKGIIGIVAEMNKMSGDYATVNSSVEVKTPEFSQAINIAENAEKEINELNHF